MRRIRTVVAAAAMIAVGLPAAAQAAAPPTVDYWARGAGGLAIAHLSGSKVTGSTVIAKTDMSHAYFPSSSLGAIGAGTYGTYNKTTYMYEQALYTYDRTHKKMHVLTSIATDQVSSPSLFNAGTSVSYIDNPVSGTAPDTIRELPSVGGARPAVAYTAAKGTTLTGLAAGAAGKTFYFAANTGKYPNVVSSVYSYTLAGKVLRLLARFKNGNVTSMVLSPNGATLAYGPGNYPPPSQGVVLVKVAAGGVSKSLSYHGDPATMSWAANGASLLVGDQSANGWSTVNVATGKTSALDYTSTGSFMDPVRV
jgi:hypothetical protein